MEKHMPQKNRSTRKIYYIIFLSLVILTCLILNCREAQPQPTATPAYRAFDTAEQLKDFLHWSPRTTPLISAHRGGPMASFPENALETFDNALRYAPCIIECDISRTRDGILMLMHDETLDRTTNGKGKVSGEDWAALKLLRLKDERGDQTPYRIPTLEETLHWARGKAILTLDIKQGIEPAEIVAAIAAQRAEAYSIVITYNLKTARDYHRLNPNLMISASAGDMEGVSRLLNSEINPANLIVFVGVREPQKTLYSRLHENGIQTILGAIGNYDRQAARRGNHIYVGLLQRGADILATDRVPQAAAAIATFLGN